MYRIVQTTDSKYLNINLESIDKDIKFPDGFVMIVDYMKDMGKFTEIGNANYIILMIKE